MFFSGLPSEITDCKRESIELRSDAAENAGFRDFATTCKREKEIRACFLGF